MRAYGPSCARNSIAVDSDARDIGGPGGEIGRREELRRNSLLPGGHCPSSACPFGCFGLETQLHLVVRCMRLRGRHSSAISLGKRLVLYTPT